MRTSRCANVCGGGGLGCTFFFSHICVVVMVLALTSSVAGAVEVVVEGFGEAAEDVVAAVTTDLGPDVSGTTKDDFWKAKKASHGIIDGSTGALFRPTSSSIHQRGYHEGMERKKTRPRMMASSQKLYHHLKSDNSEHGANDKRTTPTHVHHSLTSFASSVERSATAVDVAANGAAAAVTASGSGAATTTSASPSQSMQGTWGLSHMKGETTMADTDSTPQHQQQQPARLLQRRHNITTPSAAGVGAEEKSSLDLGRFDTGNDHMASEAATHLSDFAVVSPLKTALNLTLVRQEDGDTVRSGAAAPARSGVARVAFPVSYHSSTGPRKERAEETSAISGGMSSNLEQNVDVFGGVSAQQWRGCDCKSSSGGTKRNHSESETVHGGGNHSMGGNDGVTRIIEAKRHNIFKLDYSEGITTQRLWMVLLGMVVLTMCVDRMQALCNQLASGDRCDEMFVTKMNAEVLLFGVVAICFFISKSYFTNLSLTVIIAIEFIDILCSLAACALIFAGGLLQRIPFVLLSGFSSSVR